MLAAGYRRVVGTMWSIRDSTAQRVAVEFYDYLFKHSEEGSGDRFDGSLSAYALHHAVQELRKTTDYSETSLLTWLPFVHFGN
jgi:CHAT domain-containing protein